MSEKSKSIITFAKHWCLKWITENSLAHGTSSERIPMEGQIKPDQSHIAHIYFYQHQTLPVHPALLTDHITFHAWIVSGNYSCLIQFVASHIMWNCLVSFGEWIAPLLLVPSIQTVLGCALQQEHAFSLSFFSFQ